MMGTTPERTGWSSSVLAALANLFVLKPFRVCTARLMGAASALVSWQGPTPCARRLNAPYRAIASSASVYAGQRDPVNASWWTSIE